MYLFVIEMLCTFCNLIVYKPNLDDVDLNIVLNTLFARKFTFILYYLDVQFAIQTSIANFVIWLSCNTECYKCTKKLLLSKCKRLIGCLIKYRDAYDMVLVPTWYFDKTWYLNNSINCQLAITDVVMGILRSCDSLPC